MGAGTTMSCYVYVWLKILVWDKSIQTLFERLCLILLVIIIIVNACCAPIYVYIYTHAYAHIICQWTDMTFWLLSDNFDPPHDQGIDAMQATRGFRNKFNRSIKQVWSLLFWKLCCSCVFWLLISYQRWFTMIPSPLQVVSVSESCFGAYKVAILGRFVRRTLEWSGTMAAGRRGRGQWTSAEPILMQELILLTSMFCVAACIYIYHHMYLGSIYDNIIMIEQLNGDRDLKTFDNFHVEEIARQCKTDWFHHELIVPTVPLRNVDRKQKSQISTLGSWHLKWLVVGW